MLRCDVKICGDEARWVWVLIWKSIAVNDIQTNLLLGVKVSRKWLFYAGCFIDDRKSMSIWCVEDGAIGFNLASRLYRFSKWLFQMCLDCLIYVLKFATKISSGELWNKLLWICTIFKWIRFECLFLFVPPLFFCFSFQIRKKNKCSRFSVFFCLSAQVSLPNTAISNMSNVREREWSDFGYKR